MAVSFVAASSGSSAGSTSTSFVTTLPTGWAGGDVAILVGHVSATSLTMTTPAGWLAVPGITNPTNEGANSRVYAWYRVLQAGDTAPTVTNSGATTGGWDMAAYRGADQASPIGQAATSTAAATSAALPSLTGVTAGAALHAFAHARVATGTIPTGLNWAAAYTESLDVATSRATTAANIRFADARQLASAAGGYGGESVTVANAISSSMITGLIEIKAAGATPSTVALTAAALTLSAVAVSPVPKPVTATLASAALTLTAVPVTPAPLPVTVTLTPAAITLSAVAPAVTAVVGPRTVTLTPATLTLTAAPLTATPRPVTRTLATALLRLTAVPLGVTPLVITVTLRPATLTLAAPPLTPIAQQTVMLTAAALRLAAVPVELVFHAAPHAITASHQPQSITAATAAAHVAGTVPTARVAATPGTQAGVRRTA